MSYLEKLERKFGWIAVPHLALYIICGQMIGLMLIMLRPEAYSMMVYHPAAVASGEVWRLLSFVLIPISLPSSMVGYLFLAFAWYIFHMMSSTLESMWGAFRFTLYVFLWILLTSLFGLLAPYIAQDSSFLYLSVFFAFAYLFPNYEFVLFFILPVKVKWLAWIAAAGIILASISAGPFQVIISLGSFLNFFLFFGKDILSTLKSKKRSSEVKAAKAQEAVTPFHSCGVCGATDISRPDLDFRYRGDDAICEECIEKEKAKEPTEEKPAE